MAEINHDLAQHINQTLANGPVRFGKGKKHDTYLVSFQGTDYVVKVCRKLSLKEFLKELFFELRQHIRFYRYCYEWGGRAFRKKTWKHEGDVISGLAKLELPSLQLVPIGFETKRVTIRENLINLKEYIRDLYRDTGTDDLPRNLSLDKSLGETLSRVFQSLSKVHETIQRSGLKRLYQLDSFIGNVLIDSNRVLFIDAEYLPDTRCKHSEIQAEGLQNLILSLFNELLPLNYLDEVIHIMIDKYPDKMVITEIAKKIEMRRFKFLNSLWRSDDPVDCTLSPELLAKKIREALAQERQQ